MKKLLLLLILSVLAFGKAKEDRFPKMTREQKKRIKKIDAIVDRMFRIAELRKMGPSFSERSVEESKSHDEEGREVTKKALVFRIEVDRLNIDEEIKFHDEEIDSYYDWYEMMQNDCDDIDSHTRALKPENVKMCTELRDMLLDVGFGGEATFPDYSLRGLNANLSNTL